MKDYLDRDLDTPLYKQIKKYILDNIRNSVYEPGKVIPTERELSERFEVSRYTIRMAITELVHEGYLYRVQGNGTFVYEKDPLIAKNQSKIIGVIAPSFKDEYYIKIINGIEEYIWQEGYIVAFSSSEDDYIKEAENIQRMKENGAAGLIILPAEDQEDSTAISDLKSESFPFVLVDRRLDDCETDCVMSDNIEGGYKATQYLIKLGHERIAFVKEIFSKTSSINDRVHGYKKALKDYGIEYNSELVYTYNEDKETGNDHEKLYNFIQKMKPTAIIAIHDFLAINVIFKVCKEYNISVPEDISLIGFDNLEYDRYLETPLTTVTQYPQKIGYNAARLLLNRIKARKENRDDDELIHQIYCPVDLISRESCKPVEVNNQKDKEKNN